MTSRRELTGIAPVSVTTILRIEGLAALLAALVAYQAIGGNWWLLAALILAPDLAMLGMLIAPKHAAQIYNLAHTYTLPAILAAMDQPSIDGVNTWFVSKATAEIGLKVAVSGLGGDELFGGYGTFHDIPRIQRAMRWTAPFPPLGRALRRAAQPLLDLVPGVHPKLAGLAEYGGSIAGAYLLKRGLFMPWELPSLLPHDVAREGLQRLAPVERIERLMQPRPRHAFAQVATLEACQYMRNQLLRDTDWASMAHSLEVRVPLVDHELLTRLASLIVQSPQLDAKARLAESPHRALPAEVRAHTKTGFSTPLARWLPELPELDAWRRVPSLAKPQCPWARRYAYAVGSGVFSA